MLAETTTSGTISVRDKEKGKFSGDLDNRCAERLGGVSLSYRSLAKKTAEGGEYVMEGPGRQMPSKDKIRSAKN